MTNFNPIQVINAIKTGQNPQQIVMDIVQQQMGNTPLGQNLLNLAQDNKTKEIESIARNIVSQRGVDFDLAFSNFKNSLGIK